MADLQNHIHLSDTLGSAPENAPTYKWKVSDRKEIPTVFVSIKRALKGKIHIHALRDSDGNVVQLTNYDYIVVVQDDGSYTAREKIDILKGFYGKRLKLVDTFHPDDGDDHTPAVRNVVLSQIGEIPMFSQNLARFYVGIKLEDDSL